MNTSKNLSKDQPGRVTELCRNPFFVWSFFLICNGLVIRSAVLPASEFPRWFGHLNDKAVHAAEFFAFFWPARAAFSITRIQNSRQAASIAVGYSLVLGAVTEVLQIWVPSRSADVLDFAADAFGVSAAFLLGFLFKKKEN